MSLRRKPASLAVAAALVFGGAACSSSGSTAKAPSDTTQAPDTMAADTTVAASVPTGAAKPLLIVVTDDDGIAAGGIDEVTRQLEKLPNVTIKVVAPATNQSGKGDATTKGTVKHKDGKTASGIAGVAVEGTPADSVNVALDDLGLKPDLVVSGINQGQNVGPISAVSGTVGAALTAARRGIPAIAGSAAIVNPDYSPAAKLVIEWITKNRSKIAAHTMDTKHVVNINAPGCTSGSLHGLVEVPTAKKIPKGVNVFSTDCAKTDPNAKPTDDVDALIKGFAAQSPVPIS